MPIFMLFLLAGVEKARPIDAVVLTLVLVLLLVAGFGVAIIANRLHRNE